MISKTGRWHLTSGARRTDPWAVQSKGSGYYISVVRNDPPWLRSELRGAEAAAGLGMDRGFIFV